MSSRISKIATCALFCAFTSVFAGPGLADGAAKFLGNIPVDGEVPADFAEYWNQISPDRECVWIQIEKNRGEFDFSKCDAIYNWAKQNGVLFKFRTLVWGSQYPGWIRNLNVEETREAITAWFDAVAEHYPDLEMIDVVAEAGRLSKNKYHSAFGVDNHLIEALGGDNDGDYKFVTTAFKMARERWPKAILIYNDYNTFQWQRDVGINLINTIKKNGAPVDGYGLQGHDLVSTGSGPTNCLNINIIKKIPTRNYRQYTDSIVHYRIRYRNHKRRHSEKMLLRTNPALHGREIHCRRYPLGVYLRQDMDIL